MKEIIWKWRNFATVYDKVVHLVASESLDGRAQHLGILYVATISDHLDLGLARIAILLVRSQVARQPSAAWQALRASVYAVMALIRSWSGPRPVVLLPILLLLLLLLLSSQRIGVQRPVAVAICQRLIAVAVRVDCGSSGSDQWLIRRIRRRHRDRGRSGGGGGGGRGCASYAPIRNMMRRRRRRRFISRMASLLMSAARFTRDIATSSAWLDTMSVGCENLAAILRLR